MNKNVIEEIRKFLNQFTDKELLEFIEDSCYINVDELCKNNKDKNIEIAIHELQEIDEMYLPEVVQDIIDEYE